MKVNWSQLVYAAVAVALMLALYLLRGAAPEVAQVAQLPVATALAAALLMLVRDEAGYRRAQALADVAHERQLMLAEVAAERASLAAAKGNSFTVGASSHMAIVAFDKHVEFSEAYMQVVQDAVGAMFSVGPDPAGTEWSKRLIRVRLQYCLWVTMEMERALKPFEDALHAMGTSAAMIDRGSLPPLSGPIHIAHVNRMYRQFNMAIGAADLDGQELSQEAAHTAVLEALRAVLGTSDLVQMRHRIVRAARDLQMPNSSTL